MVLKPYHRIVITSGISLFGTYNIFRKWADAQSIFNYERTNPLPPSGISSETCMKNWEKACYDTDLSRIAKEKPKNVSAEYSLLYALKSTERLGSKPKVFLIHTDTFGGKAASFLLSKLIRADFEADVSPLEVADIDTSDRNKLSRSLGGFMETVAKTLEDADPSFTCFAPVGGYKVMTSLGYLAGAYMGFPTAYLHEDDQALHEIPAVPIRIAESEIQNLSFLLRQMCNKNFEWTELSKDDQWKIKQHPYFFDRIDTLVGCNAFARFIMARPENHLLFKTRIKISKESEAIINGGGSDKFIRQQTEELLKKLEYPGQYLGVLRHDTNFESLKNSIFYLYRGSRKGKLIFSVAYHYDKNEDVLYINRIWTDHDIYQRDSKHGKGFFDELKSVSWKDKSDWFYS